jgi:hypothetical protein
MAQRTGPLCRAGGRKLGTSGRSPHDVWVLSAVAAPPLPRWVVRDEEGGLKTGDGTRGQRGRGVKEAGHQLGGETNGLLIDGQVICSTARSQLHRVPFPGGAGASVQCVACPGRRWGVGGAGVSGVHGCPAWHATTAVLPRAPVLENTFRMVLSPHWRISSWGYLLFFAVGIQACPSPNSWDGSAMKLSLILFAVLPVPRSTRASTMA